MVITTPGSTDTINNQLDKGSIIYVYFVSIIAALGGLLFGFDTGVISGAIPFISNHFALNAHQEGFAVSNLLIGCIIGAGLAGILSDRFGRKKILIIASVFFAVSAILSALPRTFTELIFARFMGGLAVGVASMLSPIYIAEISPARIRGRLVSCRYLPSGFGLRALRTGGPSEFERHAVAFADGQILLAVFVFERQ